jgi:hypothetical protein
MVPPVYLKEQARCAASVECGKILLLDAACFREVEVTRTMPAQLWPSLIHRNFLVNGKETLGWTSLV